MRRIAVSAPALLAACAANSPAPVPIHGETPGHTCETTDTNQFIGQPATSEAGTAIKLATKAAVLRWAPPGAMLTMDYRADRVTVYLGPDRKVTKISCG
jgi:hypothetical protein